MNRNSNGLTRREFIQRTAQTAIAASVLAVGMLNICAAGGGRRKMTLDLVCGNIGVAAGQMEAIELASRCGFESVGADGGYLASLTEEKLAALKELMKSKGLVFGAAGLPVEFRQGDDQFRDGMKALPAFAAALERAGVARVGTWLMPCHEQLTYRQNFSRHASRLREVATVLNERGIRLGLEYVGPKTSWTSRRYTFIHTLAEMKELVADIGTSNVGFLLDSWHWWHAGDTVADLLALKAREVVAVDLNDAPAGTPKDQLADGRRELPCATGVIDVGAFLNALNQIGYEGPVRAEPFNQALNQMSKENACKATAEAMKKAFALIDA